MNRLRGYVIAGALLALSAGGAGHAADAVDPLAGLAAEVSAVLNTDGAPRLLLTEKGGGSTVLRIGEEYREGWKLVSATQTAATLRKGAQTREILFKSATAAEATQGVEGLSDSIALTNAVIGRPPRNDAMGQAVSAFQALDSAQQAKYLDEAAQRLGISRERIADALAKGIPPPPAPPPPPPPRPSGPF